MKRNDWALFEKVEAPAEQGEGRGTADDTRMADDSTAPREQDAAGCASLRGGDAKRIRRS